MGRLFFVYIFVPYPKPAINLIYPDHMKELRIKFSDKEYAKLDEMRADQQSVEDFIRECLQTALPWIKSGLTSSLI